MKRLIVIADNSLIVQAVRVGLRGASGFEILSYVCGPDPSVQKILDAAPDVILIDDMDESERVVGLIREVTSRDEKLVVIVLATHVQSAWLEGALLAGASGAISKLIQPTVLGTLVREALRGHIIHAPSTVALSAGTADEQPVVELESLTDRELEILRLVAAGDTNGNIARKLWVAEATVKFHLRNIYRKLDLGNRTAACHYAHVNGLLAEPEAVAPGPGDVVPAEVASRAAGTPRDAGVLSLAAS